jgi:16S rRNA (uracil1498-N3)-methyltransferase
VNPALRASAAHVFVDDLDSLPISADDAHHLFRVLRLRDGESVTASDGRGTWRTTTVAGHRLRAAGDLISEPADASLTIAAAIPKGDRVEWMVQKLTELGVDEIIFLHCEHSVVRWKNDRVGHHLARLMRVVREAAMQSRRLWMPQLRGPLAVADVAALPGAVIADPDGESGELSGVVLIGPEGGFTDAERRLGGRSVSLGPNVLRVETAAVCAAAILGRRRR